MTDLQKYHEADQHAQTLQTLIDGQEDDLTLMLSPIVLFLKQIAKENESVESEVSITRYYKVGVYFLDDEYCKKLHGTWDGSASSDDEARKLAINALADDNIEGWCSEIVSISDHPPHENLTFEQCMAAGKHMTKCDDDGFCAFCG